MLCRQEGQITDVDDAGKVAWLEDHYSSQVAPGLCLSHERCSRLAGVLQCTCTSQTHSSVQGRVYCRKMLDVPQLRWSLGFEGIREALVV